MVVWFYLRTIYLVIIINDRYFETKCKHFNGTTVPWLLFTSFHTKGYFRKLYTYVATYIVNSNKVYHFKLNNQYCRITLFCNIIISII